MNQVHARIAKYGYKSMNDIFLMTCSYWSFTKPTGHRPVRPVSEIRPAPLKANTQ